MAMSPIGNILVTLLFTRILKMMPNGGMDSQKNWVILTAIYAIGAALMMLFCFVNVRERVVVKDEAAGDKVPLKKALPALFKNKYFILLFYSSFHLQCIRHSKERWLHIIVNGS